MSGGLQKAAGMEWSAGSAVAILYDLAELGRPVARESFFGLTLASPSFFGKMTLRVERMKWLGYGRIELVPVCFSDGKHDKRQGEIAAIVVEFFAALIVV